MAGRFILKHDVEYVSRLPGRTAAVVSSPRANGSTEIVLIRAASAPGTGHGFHSHPRQEEVLYVLSGELETWIEDEMQILRPGEAAYVPRNTVHATYSIGDESAQLLVVAAPGYDTETGIETIELGHEEPWASLRQTLSSPRPTID
jgi:quercetin dioxygenase-like cupin family protein